MLSLLLALASLAEPVLARGTQAPKGWVGVAPPTTDAQWQCANHAEHEWQVSPGRGADVAISGHVEFAAIRMALPDGVLIGQNHGEFGGKIEWQTPKAEPRLVLPNKHPVAFAQMGASVFVASGLAHLGMDEGEIIRLDRHADGGWRGTRVLDLGAAPTAAYRSDATTWIILTHTGLKRVDLSTMKLTELYRNPAWFNIYPNSIAASGNSWLIGARRAVIRLDPNGVGYAEEWLVPRSCRQLTPASAYECACSG